MPEPRISETTGREMRRAWRQYLDLVEPLRSQLHAYCRRISRNLWDAEDLVQETLLRGFGMIGRGDGRTGSDSLPIAPDVDRREIRNLRAYLFRIATNLWIDEVRRARTQELEEAMPSSASVPEDFVAAREAGAALLAHPAPQERAAVLLKDVFNFTLAEIADMLATTTGAIKAALYRGRRGLLETLPDARECKRAPSAELLDRFVQAFNARDIPSLTGMLLDTGSIEVQGIGGGRGKSTTRWFHAGMFGYGGTRTDDHHVELRVYRGEHIVIHIKRVGQDAVVEEVWRFEEEDGHIARIRDYCYCPETTAEVAAEYGMRAVNHRYQHPPEFREKVEE